MMFTELRNDMQSFSGASTPDYQLAYISSEVKDLLNELNNQFVEYLTKDILAADLQLDIQRWLVYPYYESSNKNARDCLEQCLNVRHLFGRKVKSWTDSALKCFDNFLLKLIQIDNEEVIKISRVGFKETDVYHHLINKGGIEREIGQNFRSIYQLRSAFQHIHIEEKEGMRVPRRISNKQWNHARNLIIEWFRLSMLLLITLIDERFRSNNREMMGTMPKSIVE